jgi:hypothetical protein
MSLPRGPGFLLLVLAVPVLANGAKPGGYLRWNFGAPRATQVPEYEICAAESVSYVDGNDRVLWTRELPARMTAADRALCVCRRADGKGPCASEVEYYRRDPRRSEPGFSLGTRELGNSLAVADATGLLVLDRATGDVRFDWADPAAPARFNADRIHYDFTGLEGCSGDSGPQIFTVCAGKLIWFGGGDVIAVDTASWKVVATGRYDGRGKTSHGHDSTHRAQITIGEWLLKLDGITYN